MVQYLARTIAEQREHKCLQCLIQQNQNNFFCQEGFFAIQGIRPGTLVLTINIKTGRAYIKHKHEVIKTQLFRKVQVLVKILVLRSGIQNKLH